MTDYLLEFDNLEFRKTDNGIELFNLKAMNGMKVAELLTYLQDDGYTVFGAMASKPDNGFLRVEQP